MEIRDVIPSQSPMPVQKPIEPVHMGFQQVMSRKVQSVKGRENSIEMRRSTDAGASRAPAAESMTAEQKQGEPVSAGEGAAKAEELSAVTEDLTAHSPDEEIVKDASEKEPVATAQADISALAAAMISSEKLPEEPKEESAEAVFVGEPIEEVKQASNSIHVRNFLDVHGIPHEKSEDMRVEQILSQMVTAEGEEASAAGMTEEMQTEIVIPVRRVHAESPEQSAQPVETELPAAGGREPVHPDADVESDSESSSFERKDTPELLKKAQNSKEPGTFEVHVKKTSEDRKSPDLILTNSSKSEAVVHLEIMNARADVPVVRQVVEAIKAQVRVLPGGEGMEISLSPEHLGKVSLKIEIRGGELVANIKVEQQEIKTALEASLQELRESLSQKGVSVKEINVSVSKDEHRGGQENAQSGKGKDEDEEKQEFSPLFEREIESEL